METKALNADIVISGAGPAGLTLACLFAREGLRTVLIDPEKDQPAPGKPSARTAALLKGSINVLKAAGLSGVEKIGTPLEMMRIVDDSHMPRTEHAEQVGIVFRAEDIGQDVFGLNIPNDALKQALKASAKKLPELTLVTGDAVLDYTVESGKVTVTTEQGRHFTASLIIGTDGRNSIVRKLGGINTHTRPYDQTAITCLIRHTKPHANTSTEFHRPGGPFTLVPMEENQCAIVWVEHTEDAKRYLAMKRPEFAQAIQDRTRGLVGEISLLSTPESWPLIYLSAERLTAPRAAIAAEAAHVMSPIGAQGLNLSLRDVASLAETVIEAARLGQDIGSDSVLARYERRRRLDLKSRVGGIDLYNRAIANDIAVLRDMRRAGIKGLDKAAPLKRLLMKHGLAPSVDSGPLLTGRPL